MVEPHQIKYRSCSFLNKFSLVLMGLINTDTDCIKICCEPRNNIPSILFRNAAKESIETLVRLRANIISESIMIGSLGKLAVEEDINFTSSCKNCSQFELRNWELMD